MKYIYQSLHKTPPCSVDFPLSEAKWMSSHPDQIRSPCGPCGPGLPDPQRAATADVMRRVAGLRWAEVEGQVGCCLFFRRVLYWFCWVVMGCLYSFAYTILHVLLYV